jgi:hypothetical protein
MTDARAHVRKLLHDAEAENLLIEIRPHDDPQPHHNGRSARRAWEFSVVYAYTGVEIILKNRTGYVRGRISYQDDVFRGAAFSHPSGDWMLAWCGRNHVKV